MKSIVGLSVLMLLVSSAPAAFAESSCPADQTAQMIDQLPEKCRAELDIWVTTQPDTSVDVQGDIAVGAVLPETVTFAEVPAYPHYGYVVVNKKRMLVDRKTRAVIKIY